MARDLGKETFLERIFPAWSMKTVSPKVLARRVVILFCLAVWTAILVALLR